MFFQTVAFSFCSPPCVVSELYEHHYNASTGKVLFTAAKMLCQMLEADVPMVLPPDTDLPAVIHDLACQAITVCHSGEKYSCLTAFYVEYCSTLVILS